MMTVQEAADGGVEVIVPNGKTSIILVPVVRSSRD
jgi:hypothetical protein